jgi:predicted TIM-barrel fold metal-dependent hydrolase
MIPRDLARRIGYARGAMAVIDFHAHAFPDALAERAVPQLAAEGGIVPTLTGKVGALVASMDAVGIDRAVVASIATKPDQFEPILAWSRAIASDRVVPFGSIHPDDPDPAARARAIADAGLRGVKLHPYYQKFALDEPRLAPLYRAVRDAGLVLLVHCGFDIAFPHDRACDPARVRAVADAWPGLKLVAAHLGGWMDWDEVERCLLGHPIALDLAACLEFMSPDRARRMLLAHPPDCLVFGSDTPWFDQARALRRLRELGLPGDLEEAILYKNAARLLGLEPAG